MFNGGKGGRCVGWHPYYFHVQIVLKSGSLNLLEPSGTVQVCNGIALPFTTTTTTSTTTTTTTAAAADDDDDNVSHLQNRYT